MSPTTDVLNDLLGCRFTIFSYLTPHDIARMKQLNHDYKQYTMQPSIWKNKRVIYPMVSLIDTSTCSTMTVGQNALDLRKGLRRLTCGHPHQLQIWIFHQPYEDETILDSYYKERVLLRTSSLSYAFKASHVHMDWTTSRFYDEHKIYDINRDEFRSATAADYEALRYAYVHDDESDSDLLSDGESNSELWSEDENV